MSFASRPDLLADAPWKVLGTAGEPNEGWLDLGPLDRGRYHVQVEMWEETEGVTPVESLTGLVCNCTLRLPGSGRHLETPLGFSQPLAASLSSMLVGEETQLVTTLVGTLAVPQDGTLHFTLTADRGVLFRFLLARLGN